MLHCCLLFGPVVDLLYSNYYLMQTVAAAAENAAFVVVVADAKYLILYAYLYADYVLSDLIDWSSDLIAL